MCKNLFLCFIILCECEWMMMTMMMCFVVQTHRWNMQKIHPTFRKQITCHLSHSFDKVIEIVSTLLHFKQPVTFTDVYMIRLTCVCVWWSTSSVDLSRSLSVLSCFFFSSLDLCLSPLKFYCKVVAGVSHEHVTNPGHARLAENKTVLLETKMSWKNTPPPFCPKLLPLSLASFYNFLLLFFFFFFSPFSFSCCVCCRRGAVRSPCRSPPLPSAQSPSLFLTDATAVLDNLGLSCSLLSDFLCVLAAACCTYPRQPTSLKRLRTLSRSPLGLREIIRLLLRLIQIRWRLETSCSWFCPWVH